MSSPSRAEPKVEEFSLSLFLATVVISFAALIVAAKFIMPEAMWRIQVSSPWWKWTVAFLAASLANCFLEFFLHRYVLHKPVIPFLRYFYRQHTKHHSLTRICRKRTPGGMDVPFVENLFPITEPEQTEASFFPWYTLPIFGAAMSPLFALAQWCFPSFPWFIAGFSSLAASLALYEVFHAIEHWAFERWAPLIEHPTQAWFWRRVYSFHLRHHAVIDCNEAISGFFTLPVADLAFGTCVVSKHLFTDKEKWEPTEFKSPRPYLFIRLCDRIAESMVKRQRMQSVS
jgi:hemolysin III